MFSVMQYYYNINNLMSFTGQNRITYLGDNDDDDNDGDDDDARKQW